MVLQDPVTDSFVLSSAGGSIPAFSELGAQRRAGEMAPWAKETAAKPDSLSCNSADHIVEGAN